MEREKKIDTLRKLADSGQWERAVRFAARFPRLGEYKKRIERAQAAWENPRFMEQLGFSIADLKADGILALCERYHFTPPQ
jgi:hypothetical protein